MFGVHQQTIRMYEKEGLIVPKRSAGNTRLFSEEDVERLEEIINLTHKMGVNLAGVEIILKLQKKMKRMQQDMNKLFDQAHNQLEKETEDYKQDVKKQADRLVEIKKENLSLADKKKQADEPTDDEHDDVVVIDDWKIDYGDDEK